MESNQHLDAPRWLHWWSILTVVAAVPLLFLGAEVTTKGVGMVDPSGLRSPWFFFEELFKDHGLGWLIEHGHRTVGWIVGFCVIVMFALTWRWDRRPLSRILCSAVLAAVCVQGALGGFRIALNAIFGKSLALIHGAFAPIVFTLLLSMAVVTSRSWADSPKTTPESRARLKRASLLVMALVYCQFILGGLVRHMDFAVTARLHLLGAFVVLAAVMCLVKLAVDEKYTGAGWKVLIGLLSLQIFLGIESWLSKFFMPTAPWNQLQPFGVHPEMFRSLHYVVGTMMFAVTAVITLNVHHQAALITAIGPPLRDGQAAARMPAELPEAGAPRLGGAV